MPARDEIVEVEVDDDAETLPRPRTGLEEYERSGVDKPPFILTRAELKLLGIAGVGFFLDGASSPCRFFDSGFMADDDVLV